MKFFRLFYRTIFLSLHSLFFLFFGLFFNFFLLFVSKKRKRILLSILTQLWAKSFLKVLNLKIDSDLSFYNEDENYLIVANHLSWVDVIIFGSIFKVQFISKKEVSSWLLIGTLAKIGGTIFIDRKKITHGFRISSMLAETLKLGSSVVIFPESKSSIGNSVLPFKPSLFLSAIESGKKVLPVTLDFGLLNGKPFVTDEDKISFSWFDDMVLPPHLLKFLQIKKISMKIITHKPIDSNNGIDARELAQKSYDAVVSGMESLKRKV